MSLMTEELVSFTWGRVQKSFFWKIFLCAFEALYMMRSLYQRLVQKRLWLLFLCYALLPSEAYAYLDPGTGSMLVSALAGIAATLFFFVKGVFYEGMSFFASVLGRTHKRKKESLVFYCEGAQYWHVFQPVLEALSAVGEHCLYLTSDKADPGLACAPKTVTSRYIGKGSKAYAQLNMLEADVVCMTTPGLDVLQIHRSKGVGHYAHIMHAPGDISRYRLFGVDYYDSLFCAGPYNEASAREFERQRGTKPKLMVHAGCSYYDTMLKRKQAMPPRCASEGPARILVAPTWGPSAMLTVYGMTLLAPLAEAGYSLVVRPHPQSRLVEKKLLEDLKEQTAKYPNVAWDDSPDNFPAMAAADLLISDFSAITLDFAYVMERPVLVMDYTPDLSVYDAYYLPWEVWDFTAHRHIGRKLSLEDIPNIADIARDMLADPGFAARLQRFRSENLYHFGCAGPVIADNLLAIRNRLLREADNCEESTAC